MTKKPKLMLIDPSSKRSRPPRKLGQVGMALWNDINSEYRIEDRGGIELLAQACAAADRAEALAERIDEDGETIRTTQGLKAHPCLKDELAARSFVVRTIQRLGLNVETLKPVGRPGKPLGWVPDAN